MTLGRTLALLAVVAAACARPPAESARSEPTSCDAHARVSSERPLLVDVVMRCRGRPLTGFTLSEPASAAHVSVTGAGVRKNGVRLALSSAKGAAELRYRVNLDAIAAEQQSFDIALRSGATLVAPVSTWLAVPEPLATDIRVTVRVETPPGFRFETGLVRKGSGHVLDAHEIPVGTYAVFGRFDSQRLELDDSAISLVFADGKLDARHTVIAAWVQDSARAVGDFWRRFPVPHAMVTVVPVPGRSGVVFGKVLPESAPGIVLLVGEHTTKDDLYRDWILIHELFHLGVPSFSGEGKWFDEGLATYFEPIIRARAGWRTEESVWEEFRRAMPRGLEAIGAKGLEQAQDFAEVYWGGAIVVLMADIEIRKKTAGQRGIEDGLRGVLSAGGHASEVWPLDRTLELSDRAAGVAALEPLARAHARTATTVDLDKLFRELGVEEGKDGNDGVSLNPSAPLAEVRRAILRGSPEPARHAARRPPRR